MSFGFRHLAVNDLALWKKFAQFKKRNAYKKKKAARIIWRPGKFLPSWLDRSRQSFQEIRIEKSAPKGPNIRFH